MSKKIEKQGIQGILEYCANKPIRVSSLMYKTRSKQGIDDKYGDCSNVSKTIVKQSTDVSLGHFANGPMTICK